MNDAIDSRLLLASRDLTYPNARPFRVVRFPQAREFPDGEALLSLTGAIWVNERQVCHSLSLFEPIISDPFTPDPERWQALRILLESLFQPIYYARVIEDYDQQGRTYGIYLLGQAEDFGLVGLYAQQFIE